MATVRDYAEDMVNLFDTFGNDKDIVKRVSQHTFTFFKEFLNAAYLMRKNQRNYAKHKDKQFLERAKEYQAQFDTMLAALIDEKLNPPIF